MVDALTSLPPYIVVTSSKSNQTLEVGLLLERLTGIGMDVLASGVGLVDHMRLCVPGVPIILAPILEPSMAMTVATVLLRRKHLALSVSFCASSYRSSVSAA